jgi:hypothetical protein
MASTDSWYTRKGSFDSESSQEVDNQHFYKRFHLIFLDLGRAGDQVWYLEHMDECLVSGLYPQSNGEKQDLNLDTILSCLNIEIFQLTDYRRLKLPGNNLDA